MQYPSRFYIAATLVLAASGAGAADLGARKPPSVAPAPSSPWEFQVLFGPGIYAVHNPYGKGVGASAVYRHTGLSAEASAAYRLNSWFAPIIGVRGFTTLHGSGRTIDESNNFFQDVTRVRSSRMDAVGFTAGLQIGSGSFRVTPYGFVDFAKIKTNFSTSFALRPAAPIELRYAEQLSTPILGAGLRAQLDIYENLGLGVDAWAGSMTGKHANFTTFGGLSGYRVAAGGKLSLTARY